MAKYDPLGAFLSRRGADQVVMTFAEIEQVLGSKLPPAAGRHAAFWSNNPSNNVMTKVWLDAGYRSEQVDLAGRTLVFRRTTERAPALAGGDVIERLQAALAGTVRVMDGADLASPTGENWDAGR